MPPIQSKTMATCSFKTKLALSLTAAFSFFAMVFSLGGITLAAYLNAIEAEYSNKIDFSDLSDYFNSITKDADTGKTIYQISSEDQLRNLQMLVSLGLFDEDDVFNLTTDINWSGTPMAPIGSDDMPFNSTFNGCGHTITNLSITSTDGRNVGLFGYTSISSEVKNLILDHPTITVDGTGNYVSGSPIESVMLSAAEGMPDVNFVSDINPEAANAINIKNSADNESTIYGFPKQVTAGGITYDVIYESSDESIIKPAENSSDIRFVTLQNTDPYAQNFQLYPATITAKVGFTIDDRFGYYVLERYQFNVLGRGQVSTAITTTQDDSSTEGEVEEYHTGAFKTIHGSLQKYSTNVGFFIGKCDGKANFLGLEGGSTNDTARNGTIVVLDSSRAAVYSSTSLIGRSRLDNPLDSSAGDTLQVIYDFAGKDNQNFWGEDEGDGKMVVRDFAAGHKDSSKAYGSGYTIDQVEDIYDSTKDTQNAKDLQLDPDYIQQKNNADLISVDSKLIPSGMAKYSEIYPGTNQSIVQDDKYSNLSYFPTSSNWETISYEDTDIQNEQNVSGSFNGQVLDGGLGAGTFTKVVHGHYRVIFNISTYYRLARGITINNGVFVWSTNQFTSYFGSDPFDINISIDYVATRDIGTTYGQNSFQVLFNTYNPNAVGMESILGGGGRPTSAWTSSYVSNLFWQDLSNPYTLNDNGRYESALGTDENGNIVKDYDSNEHIIKDDGLLHNETIKIEVDRNNSASFIGGIYNTFFSGSDVEIRYPALAIGMGSNTDPNGENMKFYADIYSNNRVNGQTTISQNRLINSNSFAFVPTEGDNKTPVSDYIFDAEASRVLGIKVGFQDYITRPNENKDFQISETYYNNRERGYFNSYYDVVNGTKLYIKNLKVTFTSTEGNTESIIYNVDYINSSQNRPIWDNQTMSYESWPNSSNVSVGFDMDSTSGGAQFRFYRNNDDVHGYYSNATYPLENTGDLFNNDAILTQG